MLYQLSYFRKKPKTFQVLRMWAKMDSNHRSRKTADLQSAPFGHSGICPTYLQRTTASQHLFLSLLSDSNQRPRDYKSRALANWAKEAGGQAIHIAPLQPSTLAMFPSWGIPRELVVWDLSVSIFKRVQRYGFSLNPPNVLPKNFSCLTFVY